MKKRIIFFLPFFVHGGASESIFKLSKFLINKNFSILLISIGKNSYKHQLKKIGCDLHEINSSSSFFSIFKLRDIIRNEINKNHSQTLLISNIHYANIITLISCFKLKNIKIILTERSSLSELKIFKNLTLFLKNKIIFNLAKYLYRYSDLVITNSLYEKNFIKENFGIKNIKCVFPPSIPNVKKIINNKNKLNNKKKIIYVGRLSEEKGVFTILKALTFIKDKYNFIFEIYGEGDQKNEIKRFIQLNKLNKIFLLKGYQKNKNLIFKNANLFINASNFEGLPNALVQSINNNVYPICSNSPGGNMEVIKYGKLGLSFKTGDVNDLKKKVVFYLKKNLKLRKDIRLDHLNKYTEKNSNMNYLKILNYIK